MPGPERIGEIQRARIVAAAIAVVRERGVARVTVAHIVERSCVSRRTFYELYDDCDNCLRAHSSKRSNAPRRSSSGGPGGPEGGGRRRVRGGRRPR